MSQQILSFKSDVVVGEKRQFIAIATSGVVDSQGEIMNIEDLKKLLPILKARGMATNLGHFGINVGDTFDIYLKSFGELIRLYKRNEKVVKILSQYNPNTLAVVTEGQIKSGNKFDEMAWDMLKTGKINGVSIGAKLDPTGKRICDDFSCGNEITADGAFFELALTGENLTYPIDSRQPANRTSLILALKSGGVEIKKALKSDSMAILNIAKKSLPEKVTKSYFDDLLKSEDTDSVVAIVNNEIIGYIMIKSLNPISNHISSIAVLSEYRGRGIATMMIKSVAVNLKSQNKKILSLVVRKSNKPAINMYSKLRFDSIKDLKGQYSDGEEGVLMGFNLKSDKFDKYIVDPNQERGRPRVHPKDGSEQSILLNHSEHFAYIHMTDQWVYNNKDLTTTKEIEDLLKKEGINLNDVTVTKEDGALIVTENKTSKQETPKTKHKKIIALVSEIDELREEYETKYKKYKEIDEEYDKLSLEKDKYKDFKQPENFSTRNYVMTDEDKAKKEKWESFSPKLREIENRRDEFGGWYKLHDEIKRKERTLNRLELKHNKEEYLEDRKQELDSILSKINNKTKTMSKSRIQDVIYDTFSGNLNKQEIMYIVDKTAYSHEDDRTFHTTTYYPAEEVFDNVMNYLNNRTKKIPNKMIKEWRELREEVFRIRTARPDKRRFNEPKNAGNRRAAFLANRIEEIEEEMPSIKLKSEFKEEEHPRDGGKFSEKEGAGKKEEKEKPKKKMISDPERPWKKREQTEEEVEKEEKLSSEDKRIEEINKKYDEMEVPEFKDTQPGEEGYSEERPWRNSARTKKMKWENEQHEKRLDDLGNSNRPWRNRTRKEKIQAFEDDISQLSNHMDIQMKRNQKLTSEIKKLVSKKEKVESKEEKEEIQEKIDEKRVERFETVKRVKKISDMRKDSKAAMSSFIQSGNDLRKYLASKMGLPDAQVDKIAQMLEKAKTAEMRAVEQQAQKVAKDKKINDAEREKIKKKKEKDAKLDKKLKEKIDGMSSKEIAIEVDKMFKSYNASLNTVLTNNYEMSLKAEEGKKFDKYTVDPSQRRGRPRKEKKEGVESIPETKDFDKKYLRESLLEHAFDKDKYARAEMDRRFNKLFPDAEKKHRTPEEIEKLMGWDLSKEKEEYKKERIQSRRDDEEEDYSSKSDKFEKYTVDPSQRRGRPRKEKGEPQTEKEYEKVSDNERFDVLLTATDSKHEFDLFYNSKDWIESHFDEEIHDLYEADEYDQANDMVRRAAVSSMYDKHGIEEFVEKIPQKIPPDYQTILNRKYKERHSAQEKLEDVTELEKEIVDLETKIKEKRSPKQKNAFLDRSLPKYGSKFDEEDKNRPVKEYAKELRSDLTFLKDRGFKVRVTSKYNAISVNLTPPDDFVAFNPHYDQQKAWEIGAGVHTGGWDADKDPRAVYTPEGNKLLKLTKAYGNQWNWDKSDLQSDYHNANYYLNVDINRPKEEPKIEEPIIEDKPVEPSIFEKNPEGWVNEDNALFKEENVMENYLDGFSKIVERDIKILENELGRSLNDEDIESLTQNLITRIKNLSLKSIEGNTNGMDNRSQEGNPPQEGEFAIAQVMKILASITGRLDNLENMSSAAPMQQEPVPPQEEGQIPPPQEGQPSQIPQEGEGEEASPPPFEGSDEEEESEEEFSEEGMEGEETPEEEVEEEGESENPFAEKEEGSEEEEIEPDEIEDEEETKSRKAKALNLKMDEISSALDEIYKEDPKKKEVSVKCDDDEKAENDEDYQPENIKEDVSLKKPESKAVDDDEEVSTKSSTDCEDRGDEATSDTENNTVVEPAMKSEETEVKQDEPTITMAQMDEALAKQKEEIFEQLGVKSVETPITTVDANQSGAVEEGGKTFKDVVDYFAQKTGAPHAGEIIEFLEA